MERQNDFFDIDGSLAYDYGSVQPEYYPPQWAAPPEDEDKVIIPAPPVRREREAVRVRPRARSRQSVSPAAVLGFICVFVLLVLTLLAKIQLTRVTDEAVELESKLTELKNEQARLEIDYESAFNLTEIEEYAISSLGMQRPREEQIVYLQSTVPDKAVVLEQDQQEEKSLLERLYDLLDSIGGIF